MALPRFLTQLLESVFLTREKKVRFCRRGRDALAFAQHAFGKLAPAHIDGDKVVVRTPTDIYVYRLIAVKDP